MWWWNRERDRKNRPLEETDDHKQQQQRQEEEEEEGEDEEDEDKKETRRRRRMIRITSTRTQQYVQLIQSLLLLVPSCGRGKVYCTMVLLFSCNRLSSLCSEAEVQHNQILVSWEHVQLPPGIPQSLCDKLGLTKSIEDSCFRLRSTSIWTNKLFAVRSLYITCSFSSCPINWFEVLVFEVWKICIFSCFKTWKLIIKQYKACFSCCTQELHLCGYCLRSAPWTTWRGLAWSEPWTVEAGRSHIFVRHL